MTIIARRSQRGRPPLTINEIVTRGIGPDRFAGRAPAQLAELEAMFQCMMLARIGRGVSWKLLELRLDNLTWIECQKKVLDSGILSQPELAKAA